MFLERMALDLVDFAGLQGIFSILKQHEATMPFVFCMYVYIYIYTYSYMNDNSNNSSNNDNYVTLIMINI